jgi:imidazolonepropionase
LIDDILPTIKKENLADFIDIFCETGYFSVNDTNRILEAGKKHGLIGKFM